MSGILPHKENKFCGTEVLAMTGTLLENLEQFKTDEEAVFDKMAEVLRGKRTPVQVRAWWYNLKKIYQEEGRFTAVVEKYVLDEQKQQLIELISGKRPAAVGQIRSDPVVPPKIVVKTEQEERKDGSPALGESPIQTEADSSMEADSAGNVAMETAIQEAILKLYAALSPEGRQKVRRDTFSGPIFDKQQIAGKTANSSFVWMKLLPLTVVLVLSFFFVAADDISDRGTNAANVAQAGLDACRNSNSNVKGNTIPYLTSNSYMFSAMGVLGGVLRFYHSRQMEKQFKNSMDELNQRFDWLEDDMNSRFDELTGFVDRKQFESDITDPTTILWGMMLAYAQYPNNKTYSNMMFECMRQTPWQIATKLHNRLFGPDNTLMTQIKSNQYNNGTFMATKDTIMYRIFQLMMIQSFCIGVENGPNYEFIADWEQQRMYSIYSDIVNNTIAMRKVQEKDYFNAVVPTIASQIVTGNAHDDMQYFASRLQQTLTQQYSWDSFGVVITDTTCNQADYQGSYNNGQGGIPYAVWHTNNLPCNVWVIRYWTGDQQYSRVGQYQNCMQACYNSNPHTWANCISCGQSFEILGNTWHCGYDMRTAGTRDYYYLDGITYKDGISSAVYPNANRRTTVEYDLGFWERPIGISLLPIPDN